MSSAFGCFRGGFFDDFCVNFEYYALAKMMRNPSVGLKQVAGIMADDFPKGVKGRRFIRAHWENGEFHLPNGLHSNGVLSSMAGCNCLIDTKTMEKPESKDLNVGDKVSAILL